jgi:predicted transposase YbfD/YdcC
VDGKAVRGAGRHGQSLCLVGFVEHGTGRVLDQEAVAEKSNEITAVPVLLARSKESGVVVTMDALLTQRSIAEQIKAQGMHYLMVAKDNQPRLLASISAQFEAGPPDMVIRRHETVEKGHGRIERRILEVTDAPSAWIGWPGAAQILRRTSFRTTISTGRTSRSTNYAVTDLDVTQASAAQLEKLWRGHWTTENPVHYVRDVSMGEDACQCWVGSAPRALATLRNVVLNILRTGHWRTIPGAQRALAADASKALQFLNGIPAADLFPS